MRRSGATSRAANHELVFAMLRKTAKPLTAYELLDKLRSQGVSAPPTIYRALERLIDDGRAHRLESLNAFVACAHPHHGGSAMFSICDDCGAVEEFSDASMNKRVAGWARDTGFVLSRAILEVHGTCGACGDSGIRA
jgi:Fur family transcriptional regulator, zinc uptake regulator